MKKAVICICTFNREELLIDSIKSALNQTYTNYKLVIVDQTKQHKKETQEFLEKLPKAKVQYIFTNTPSLTKARNLALRSEEADVYIFIDDDTSFNENFVEAHVNAHEKADVVQGRIIEAKAPPTKNPQWFNIFFRCRGIERL